MVGKKSDKVSGSEPSVATQKLLSGGNPQIAKGYGDTPVQAYIAAMPGWKSAVGGRIDRLIQGVVPGVRKAVKWNSPFYGMEDDIWFLSLHCFTKYIKVTFLNGASLQPLPPGTSKHPKVRYLDIREDAFDEAQFVEWVRQASVLPGEKM
ncbi:sensor histidine protein kinase [Agrobacterium tumefaciens str. Cherry 2E-2-2]|nr:sensor histidine protein kinase [Agrobacterium tumefaciens str. Cherry 2E-2-2]